MDTAVADQMKRAQRSVKAKCVGELIVIREMEYYVRVVDSRPIDIAN